MFLKPYRKNKKMMSLLFTLVIMFVTATTNAQRIHKAKSVEDLNDSFKDVNVKGLTFVIVRFGKRSFFLNSVSLTVNFFCSGTSTEWSGLWCLCYVR